MADVKPEDEAKARRLLALVGVNAPNKVLEDIAQALASARTEGAKRMRERAVTEALQSIDADEIAERIRALEVEEHHDGTKTRST